jgi:hypothetical protein
MHAAWAASFALKSVVADFPRQELFELDKGIERYDLIVSMLGSVRETLESAIKHLGNVPVSYRMGPLGAACAALEDLPQDTLLAARWQDVGQSFPTWAKAFRPVFAEFERKHDALLCGAYAQLESIVRDPEALAVTAPAPPNDAPEGWLTVTEAGRRVADTVYPQLPLNDNREIEDLERHYKGRISKRCNDEKIKHVGTRSKRRVCPTAVANFAQSEVDRLGNRAD